MAVQTVLLKNNIELLNNEKNRKKNKSCKKQKDQAYTYNQKEMKFVSHLMKRDGLENLAQRNRGKSK